MEIKEFINQLVKEFIEENELSNGAYDINNGLCAEFAEELMFRYGGLEEISNDMFLNNLGEVEYMKELWGDNITVISETSLWNNDMLKYHGHPPMDINKINDLPSHVWVYNTADLKHYDAECPEGVKTPWELPIFVKFFETLK